MNLDYVILPSTKLSVDIIYRVTLPKPFVMGSSTWTVISLPFGTSIDSFAIQKTQELSAVLNTEFVLKLNEYQLSPKGTSNESDPLLDSELVSN